MPIIIPADSNSRREQMQMIREGLEVHNEGCCTANEPCRLRGSMTEVYRQLDAAEQAGSVTPSTRAVDATPVRPQGTGNGFGTAKPARRGKDASEAQKGMIRKMAARKDVTEYKGQPLEEFLATMQWTEVDDARQAMMDAPWPDRRGQHATAARAEAVELEAGMYRKGGVVYKVQRAVHGSGNLYAKKLNQSDDGEWFFNYAPGAISELTPEHRMTEADAKEFGALYGICCRCAATLTDEASIARGMGPTCAGKL